MANPRLTHRNSDSPVDGGALCATLTVIQQPPLSASNQRHFGLSPSLALQPTVHLLTFVLDGDRYALDAATVQLVERAVAITPLPRAPQLVEGVIDVHGTLAPVFDLRRRFGLPARELSDDEHLIVASAGDRLVAFRVDEALDLVSVPDDLARVPALSDTAAGEGVARLDDGAVAIYDLTTFLSASERASLDAALDSARASGVTASG